MGFREAQEFTKNAEFVALAEVLGRNKLRGQEAKEKKRTGSAAKKKGAREVAADRNLRPQQRLVA